MGKFSVLLCDTDEVYIKRLAAGLQRQFRDQIIVQTCSGTEQTSEDLKVDLLLTSKEPGSAWREKHEDCAYLWLNGEAENPLDGSVFEGADLVSLGQAKLWKHSVFKYQSLSAIAKAIQPHIPHLQKNSLLGQTARRQRWYGVVSSIRHEGMLPFACSLAKILGLDKKVLLIVWMEFSGLCQMLELNAASGMEEFLYQLRQKEDLRKVPLPEVHVLPGFDLLLGPDNPMVLYELNEQDVNCLIRRIQVCDQYDVVVYVAGNMIRGIDGLFKISERVFSVEKSDSFSCCSQREFQLFYEKLLQKSGETLAHVSLGEISSGQTGEHLLWQWEDSVIGNQVRSLLREEESYEGANRGVSQKDIRTIEYE